MLHGSFITIALSFLMLAHQSQQPLPIQPGVEVDFRSYQVHEVSNPYSEVSIKIFDDLASGDSIEFIKNTLPLLQEITNEDIDLQFYYIPSKNRVHQTAAHALKCAADQNQYWTMISLISADIQKLNPYSFSKFSKKIKMDTPTFSKCIRQKIYQEKIDLDVKTANDLGVSDYPSIFINQYQLIGNQPIENIKKYLSISRKEVDQHLKSLQSVDSGVNQ